MEKYLKHIREMLLFALPVIGGKISEILFGIGDVIVAGRYSTVVLGAMGVANAFIFPLLVFGVGVMSAVSPIKARKIGAGECVKKMAISSMLVSIVFGILLTILALLVSFFIVPLFNYNAEVEPLIQTYINICAISITPALVFSALKELLLARSHTLVPNLMIFLFNFLNIAMNIFFMFTLDLGIAGAAIATLLSRFFMAVVLAIYYVKKTDFEWKICNDSVFEVLKTGSGAGSVGLTIAAVFAIVAMLVGKMSVADAAANNVIIQITSITFMIPLAFSGVSSVKVGYAHGQKNLALIKEYVGTNLILGCGFAIISAIVFALFPHEIMAIFTNQPDVISVGISLIFFIAIYQFPDAIQEVLLGSLRGLGETKIPWILSVIGIWLIGLPVGCYFAYAQKMGAAGLWLGLCTGLLSMSVFFGIFFAMKIKMLEKEYKVDTQF